MNEVQEFILRRAMQKVAGMSAPLRTMGHKFGQIASNTAHEQAHASQANEDAAADFGAPALVPHEETHSAPPAWLYDMYKSRQPMYPVVPSKYLPSDTYKLDPVKLQQMHQQYFEKQQKQQQQRINNSYKPA